MGKNAEKTLNKQVKSLVDIVDYNSVNELLEKTDVELKDISKKTLLNISKWALNGADDREIANNLEITPKQFRTLCQLCPAIVIIMGHTRQMANIVLTGSLFQTAIGGQRVGKEQLVKIKEYNADGIVIGEHYEKMWVEEELPPNPQLLKYLAEHKLSEQLGDDKDKGDRNYDKVLENMDANDIAEMERALKQDESENNN